MLPVRIVRFGLFALMCVLGTAALRLFAGPLGSGALFLLLPPRGSGSPTPLHLITSPCIRATSTSRLDCTSARTKTSSSLALQRSSFVARISPVTGSHGNSESARRTMAKRLWSVTVRGSSGLQSADGTELNFKRVSRGTSYHDAMYVEEDSATDWRGSKLGWVGFEWALRKPDGILTTYRSCGSHGDYYCGILRTSYPDGHSLHYRRDAGGRLLKMDDGGSRWIAFEYDRSNRISRASDSTGREARYEYDARGRLAKVTAAGGVERRYTYTDMDELATIEEPGTSIENRYANGRCVRQVNRYPNSEPYTFEFKYDIDNETVARTRVDRSDGTWTEYTWEPDRYASAQIEGADGYQPATFTFQRDTTATMVSAMTLTCPGRNGSLLRHSSLVPPGREDRIKSDLLQTYCSWHRSSHDDHRTSR